MDKALLGAAITLLIFTLTQLFMHLRSRQNLLREKLEALFFVMNETSQSLGKVQKGLMFDEIDSVQEGFEGLEKSIYDARPLFLLYFPVFTEIWISKLIEPALEYADRVNNLTEEAKQELIDDIHQKTVEIRWLQNMMARNQDLTTETLRFHWNRVIRKRVKFNMPGHEPETQKIEQDAGDRRPSL